MLQGVTVALILVYDGMTDSLDALTAHWGGDRFCGLMMGDATPQRSWTIVNIQKCNFSGYVGEQEITGWAVASVSGELAVVSATPLIWTHNGGPQGNPVTGYYVVDSNGKLQWIELFPSGVKYMQTATDVASVTPRFAVGSRFPT